MEVKKATSIRSMEYEDFKNNDYLEEMVRRLNMDGAGIVLGTVDELINWGRSNSLWSLTFGTSCCAISGRHDYGAGNHHTQNGSGIETSV